MRLLRRTNKMNTKADELAKADRAERFEIYKLMVEMADRVSQRRQGANSFYLSINTFLITASAYVGTSEAPPRVILLVCFAGVAVSILWIKAIESYKSLNTCKFTVINALEVDLVEQPFTQEWAMIDPVLHGKKHRPFHQIERLVPKLFIALFLLQGLSVVPWKWALGCIVRLIHGGAS